MGSHRLQGCIEGSAGLLRLPLGSRLPCPGSPALPLLSLVPLPALLLALQQASPLLEDLVLKGPNHTDEMLHMLQIHLCNAPAHISSACRGSSVGIFTEVRSDAGCRASHDAQIHLLCQWTMIAFVSRKLAH